MVEIKLKKFNMSQYCKKNILIIGKRGVGKAYFIRNLLSNLNKSNEKYKRGFGYKRDIIRYSDL